MDYRLLGCTGVRVAPLSLGTLNFGEGTDADTAIRLVHTALDAGINLVDTANNYNGGRSEEIVGRALAGRRHDVILATKVFNRMGDGPNDGGTSRLHILKACEESLRRLQTDYIDLYQVHRPDSERAARGDAGRAHRPGARRQGALHRLLDAPGVDGDGSAGDQRAAAAWRATSASSRPTTCSTGASRTSWSRWRCATTWRSCHGRRWRRACWQDATRSEAAAGRLARRPASPAASTRAASRSAASPPACVSPSWRARSARQPGNSRCCGARTSPASPRPSSARARWSSSPNCCRCSRCALTDEERVACDAINPPGSVVTNFHNTAGWMKTVVA